VSVSQDIREWVDRFIAQNPPGTQLPFDRNLARLLDCSVMSVRRVLSDYAAKGLLQRRNRRGTRIPPSPASEEQHQAPESTPRNDRRRSVTAIHDDLLKAIASGTYKRGTALPLNKQIALQLQVSTHTVTSAYRLLEKEGYATKVGKRYWVGGVAGSLNLDTRRECVVLSPDDLSLGSLLRFQPRDMGSFNLSMALQKTESHLEAEGWRFAYHTYSELRALTRRWKERGYLPDGFMLFGRDQGFANEKDFRTMHGALSALASRMHVPLPRTLVVAKNFICSAPRCLFFSIGHTYKVRARATAQFALRVNPANLTVIFTEDSQFRDLMNFLRIYPEIRGTNTTMNLAIMLVSDEPDGAPGRILRKLDSTYGFEHLKMRMAVDGTFSREDLKGLFHGTRSITEPLVRMDGRSMFVFRYDEHAAEALQWCTRHRVRLGEDVFLLSFDNNPDFFGRGISACISDWETDGYLMAHALIGDIPIARTRRGFIRAQARILRRLTA